MSRIFFSLTLFPEGVILRNYYSSTASTAATLRIFTASGFQYAFEAKVNITRWRKKKRSEN